MHVDAIAAFWSPVHKWAAKRDQLILHWANQFAQRICHCLHHHCIITPSSLHHQLDCIITTPSVRLDNKLDVTSSVLVYPWLHFSTTRGVCIHTVKSNFNIYAHPIKLEINWQITLHAQKHIYAWFTHKTMYTYIWWTRDQVFLNKQTSSLW